MATVAIERDPLSAYGEARSTVEGAPLDPDELRLMDAYWRASLYLCLGMIDLKDNPLLREPLTLDHLKTRLLGHWGSDPGQSFIYVHLNRLIKTYDLDAIFLSGPGPGHGAPALLSNAYLEGTYSEVYPDKSEDADGLRKFFKQFSFPGGIGSHCTPETPGRPCNRPGATKRAEARPMSEALPEVHLARHGETAWTVANRHTGRTDLPLTERGERNAADLRDRLRGQTFTRVLVSPLKRALRTCELAGFADVAEAVPDLTEWDYGAYEGRRTAEIRIERPGWSMFRDGCPGGESVADAGDRADRVIARLREAGGRILLFGHGHFFRVLAARWLGLPPGDACHLLLNTASLSILTYEHTPDDPAVRLWNDDRHVRT